ncbi:esterase [Nocardioides sp. OK12]|nr:esterase [Nocardioides sp. OK12]
MVTYGVPMTAVGDPGPFSAHLGFRVVRADADGAVVEADPGPEHLNGGGILHGGYLSALLDSATGWAVHAAGPEGMVAPHVQLNAQFLKAGVAGQPLVCTATCTSVGGRICTTQGEVTQAGRVIARATGTHAVISRG